VSSVHTIGDSFTYKRSGFPWKIQYSLLFPSTPSLIAVSMEVDNIAEISSILFCFFSFEASTLLSATWF